MNIDLSKAFVFLRKERSLSDALRISYVPHAGNTAQDTLTEPTNSRRKKSVKHKNRWNQVSPTQEKRLWQSFVQIQTADFRCRDRQFPGLFAHRKMPNPFQDRHPDQNRESNHPRQQINQVTEDTIRCASGHHHRIDTVVFLSY